MIHEDTRALDRGNVFFHYRMREARFHFAYRKDSFRDLSYYVYSRGTVTSERIYKSFCVILNVSLDWHSFLLFKFCMIIIW